MRTLTVVAGFALSLGGCASNAPQMAWGKPGVSKVEYGTDVGMCNGLAVSKNIGNGANTAGGIDGKAITNAGSSPTRPSPPPANSGNAGQVAQVEAPIPAGGTYSGMASADFAQRAATQQRAQEMTVQRARAEALKTCLAGRGYQEFALTFEQRAHLATLKKGGNEYHEYLYELGSDAEIVGKQSRAPAK